MLCVVLSSITFNTPFVFRRRLISVSFFLCPEKFKANAFVYLYSYMISAFSLLAVCRSGVSPTVESIYTSRTYPAHIFSSLFFICLSHLFVACKDMLNIVVMIIKIDVIFLQVVLAVIHSCFIIICSTLWFVGGLCNVYFSSQN